MTDHLVLSSYATTAEMGAEQMIEAEQRKLVQSLGKRHLR
jgi:uncharacterized protein